MDKPCLAHGCLVWSDVVSIQPDEDMTMASGSSHHDNVPIINSYELNYVVPRLSHRYKSYDPQTPNYILFLIRVIVVNTKCVIFQPYHGENKIHFDEKMG